MAVNFEQVMVLVYLFSVYSSDLLSCSSTLGIGVTLVAQVSVLDVDFEQVIAWAHLFSTYAALD